MPDCRNCGFREGRIGRVPWCEAHDLAVFSDDGVEVHFAADAVEPKVLWVDGCEGLRPQRVCDLWGDHDRFCGRRYCLADFFGDDGLVLGAPDLDVLVFGDAKLDGLVENDLIGAAVAEALGSPELTGSFGLGTDDAGLVLDGVADTEVADGDLLSRRSL